MIINQALYVKGTKVPGPEDLSELLNQAKKKKGFLWIGVGDPTPEEMSLLASELELHPLAVEDALNAKQRPKIERYGAVTFFTIKTIYRENETLTTGEILSFLGDNFIITIRHGSGSSLSELRNQAEQNPQYLKLGPYSILHYIIDKVIDDSIRLISELEIEVSEVERAIFVENYKSQSEIIYRLKREVIEYHYLLEPLKIPLQELVSETNKDFPSSLKPFFRDTLDHLLRASDHAQNLDQILSNAHQADLSNLQLQQNNDLRRISAWVALASGPTMIAGIYGMNFKYMPELESKFGYPVVLSLLILGTLLLYKKLKNAKWL